MVARTCGTPPQRTGPASPVSFRSSTRLRFDDSGNNALPIDLVGLITPSSIVVSNVTKDYTIGTSTSGSLGGQFTLTKTGAGKLTLTTDNSFEGNSECRFFEKPYRKLSFLGASLPSYPRSIRSLRQVRRVARCRCQDQNAESLIDSYEILCR